LELGAILWSFRSFNILVVSIATAAIWKTSKAQLHMAYDIPTRFHKVWSRHLPEMCWTNIWRKNEFNFFFYSFHQTSWNFVRISTVVCGSYWGVE
jgi:hypothetical protein